MSLTSYRAAPPRVGVLCGLCVCFVWIGRPGGDLLSRALRHSTMGAGGFHGRVRDGIGCGLPAVATRSSNPDGPCLSTRCLSVGQVLVNGASASRSPGVPSSGSPVCIAGLKPFAKRPSCEDDCCAWWLISPAPSFGVALRIGL